MVINTKTVLALSCIHCGQTNFYNISAFSFSGKKRLVFSCSCGQNTVSISSIKHKRFVLKIQCDMCELEHAYYLKYKELFCQNAFSLLCFETGLEIVFIGPEKQVMTKINHLEQEYSDLMRAEGLGEYLDNRDIMLEILEYAHILSGNGLLKCQCGNLHLGVDIFANYLEITCNKCGNKGIVFGESKADLLALKGYGKVELSESNIVIRGIEPSPITKKEFKK